MTGETVGQDYFRAELVPAVWLLTHRYNSRIFQNKNVPDIITDVLTQAGIPSDRVEDRSSPARIRPARVLRPVPRDRLQLHLPPDGGRGHLVVLRADPGQATS